MPTRDQDKLRRYLAGRDAPCPNCGYNLRGLEHGRCPECAFGFNLGALKTRRDYVPLHEAMWDIDRWWWPLAVNFVLLIVGAIAETGLEEDTWFQHLTAWPGPRRNPFYAAIAVGVLAMRWIAGWHETSPVIARRLYTAVAVPVWVLTAVSAAGVVCTLLAAATQ